MFSISIKKYLFILIFFFSLLSYKLLSSEYIQHQGGREENRLTILSWNIKMFPPPYGWLHNRFKRSENIIEALKNSERYDIILFQESFSVSIRKKIFNALKDVYPNQIILNDKTKIYKSNSGLWAISSIPITLIDKINFTELRHTDRLSSKGAHLYSVIKNQQEFHIINTHMQADYNTQYSDVRTQQYTEIKEKLLIPFEVSEIPFILCGDLNISKLSKLNMMLETLNFMNGPLLGKLQYSSLNNNHELLDYILVKKNKFKLSTIERRIQDMSVYLKIDSNQFSDHYPVEGVIKW